jgi:hypothetical protein
LALAERVARIEELLGREEKGQAGRDNQHTLHKVTSIQDLMRGSRKQTV